MDHEDPTHVIPVYIQYTVIHCTRNTLLNTLSLLIVIALGACYTECFFVHTAHQLTQYCTAGILYCVQNFCQFFKYSVQYYAIYVSVFFTRVEQTTFIFLGL